jgi:hypothetical protein
MDMDNINGVKRKYTKVNGNKVIWEVKGFYLTIKADWS